MASSRKHILLLTLLLCFFGGFSAQASAQTRVATFTLDNVWLDPDITRPGVPPEQLTGTFQWTYQVGDFANGSGEFLDIYVPWFGSSLASLSFTIDIDSIEISLNGNYQGLGVDVLVRLTSDLHPTTPAVVDTVNSTFHIEQGNYRGHMTSGSVHTIDQMELSISGVCPSMQFDITGVTANGQMALLYANGQGSFAVPNGVPCAGVVLGLDNTTQLATMLTADGTGLASFSANVPAGVCGAVYLQALDLTTCGLSDVVLLQ